MVYKDETIMPFGKHKGEKMINIPASHLLWLYEQEGLDSEIKKYIEYNLDVLQMEYQKETYSEKQLEQNNF